MIFIFFDVWGIVRAPFKLPKYDITFSSLSGRNKYKQRMLSSLDFKDYNHLEHINKNTNIVFFGGSKYITPFCNLTKNIKNKKL
ncbi:hypothetical protein CBLAS_1810 [Campylobacter blaseri]|uniref:Uncharacterized protein n=1 Tax=Campylobacter blaseri TaxID=2042961 RepID=A0A2P8R3N3_9BACT|nr:hypothetical protein [Campylobacter blaseri]PSM53107.1 hypothetical protein CQ405_00725 [Campylobacter blaseri]PSM54573.1 hypothetical protein CRN67_00725 [Campylobacter blaseri]QKF86954.1 hypothetical protein CBLAS_1810 [Campylobacter blaseri]